MMKDLLIQQNHQIPEVNMSNLTSASAEATLSSSSNKPETAATILSHHYFAPPAADQAKPPLKKKRNLPGNPDPEAEVIALSPRSLLATNRFVCEVCNKGFQRDQNLQLHRRGHNLPWKLKQRASKEVRKKVYVCPEQNCVHHHPARALGDLTGIKKHFCRKHGEKKWKCDKCSKRYAVQSDWKAHSKTCGTREYRCDCGTLFSRRDSFITHRAFCDALAEEGSRPVTVGTTSSTPTLHTQVAQDFDPRPPEQLPPWLACPPPAAAPAVDLSSSSPSSIFSPSTRLSQDHHLIPQLHESPSPNPSPSPRLGPTLQHYQPAAMSATALLQKAAQMGATLSTKTCSSVTPHHPHVLGLDFASHEENMASGGFGHGLLPDPFKSSAKAAAPSATPEGTTTVSADQDIMMNSLSSASTVFVGSSFHGGFGNGDHQGMTRDFLGLRPLSHSDILTIAGLNAHEQSQNQPHKSWQG
ncbi:protein indeterminate-domain 7-like [Diospyros lotus]|uniref:protein indeterminate-domain 7-like n=1 Tax=Diospyros lotus TaxID=55363 RepID=UPI00224E04B1|nr:protein indeterminate-domain 7-like [Diospyros lotus]XP_052183691.1 protein indeterminate-domain 7-like [Diospyros lotus]